MTINEIFQLMTDNELDRLFEHLTSAAGIFVGSMNCTSEVERMVKSKDYAQLAYMRTAVFTEIAKRNQQKEIQQ